jgi:hypothetical protein
MGLFGWPNYADEQLSGINHNTSRIADVMERKEKYEQASTHDFILRLVIPANAIKGAIIKSMPEQIISTPVKYNVYDIDIPSVVTRADISVEMDMCRFILSPREITTKMEARYPISGIVLLPASVISATLTLKEDFNQTAATEQQVWIRTKIIR